MTRPLTEIPFIIMTYSASLKATPLSDPAHRPTEHILLLLTRRTRLTNRPFDETLEMVV